MKHKRRVEHYPDHKALAEEIGNLRYDALADLFHELKLKFTKDSNEDLKRKRPKLSGELLAISARMRNAQRAAEKAWDVCEPYMMKGIYHGWIVDIDDVKKEVYIEFEKEDDRGGYRYNANIPTSDFDEEDQKIIEIGRTLVWTQKLKSKEVKINPPVFLTKEQIEEATKRAEELYKNIKWK